MGNDLARAWLKRCCGMVVLVPASCAVDPDIGDGSAAQTIRAPIGPRQNTLVPNGALVDVAMQSQVGVVLDEIPTEQRSAAAVYYLSQPEAFWIDRAKHQLRHTNYRLTYRDFFYSDASRRMMALPPEQIWKIRIHGKHPHRVRTEDGHDAVLVGYSFRSTLLTDADSPALAEPRLREVGGTWDEPFYLPLDPEFLFQRTGYACMDEDSYPLGTVRSENAAQMFDQECDVETADTASCHFTAFPTVSCVDALARSSGKVNTAVRFERRPYDPAVAERVRIGTFTQQDAPDLEVIPENLEHHWVEYRYFPSDSCAISEQCVGGSGWRRLLLFDASIKNVGERPLVVGSTEENSPGRANNLFEFSACHEHFHFRHYGNFSYGPIPGDKRAFCVESTDRYFNNESTPLVHDFSCSFQGVAPGWGDTYIAGVECNWIDVTDLSIDRGPTLHPLRFEVNPDEFLCEGEPVLDEAGNPVYEATSFITEDGQAVNRPQCNFAPRYDANNRGARAVRLSKQGGLVTEPCTRRQAGPLRDCGFGKQAEHLPCTPNAVVELECVTGKGNANQVVRVCDNSLILGGIPCAYNDALESQVVTSQPTAVSFRCPTARDTTEVGGSYSLYVGPVLPWERAAPVTCRVRE